MEKAIELKYGSKSPSRMTCYELADVRAIREYLYISQREVA